MGTMINRRRVCGGKSLPYDAEIEYLESTGTQWIDTLVNKKETKNYLSVAINIRVPSLGSGEQDIAGSGAGDTPTMGYSGINYFSWANPGTTWYPKAADTNWHNNIYTFYVGGGRTFSEDGVLYQSNYGNAFGGAYDTLFLFASSPNRFPLKCQLKSTRIIIDDILKFDAIPVRVGQVGYMYDRVSKQLFGNIGTGSFMFPIPDNSKYTEIEYLESTGTQYIMTDVLTEKGLVTEIDFEYTSLIDDMTLFGSWGENIIYECTLHSSKWYFGSYSTSESNVRWYEGSPNTDRHLIKLDGNGSLYQDGHLLTTIGVSEKTSARNIYIFTRNGNEHNRARIKCYGVRCFKNDVLIADFIPVRVDFFGGALYDKISKKFYSNAGTGSFILGPDVNN